MKITATKIETNDYAVFTWDQDMTTCNHVAVGVEDEDWDMLISNKVHEGSDLQGWVVEID